MSKQQETAHPALPHEQPHPQSLGQPQAGEDYVVFSGVASPYQGYNSHSYPIPNLSISSIRSISMRLDTAFIFTRAAALPLRSPCPISRQPPALLAGEPRTSCFLPCGEPQLWARGFAPVSPSHYHDIPAHCRSLCSCAPQAVLSHHPQQRDVTSDVAS